MIDIYAKVKVNRISPEFPIPVMHSESDIIIEMPGGVANVANQFKHFNVEVKLQCFADKEAKRVFEEHGLKTETVNGKYAARLPVKKRFIADSITVSRHDIEFPTSGLTTDEIKDYIECLTFNISRANKPNVAIFSDYNKGFFSSNHNFLQLYKDVKTIVDPKKGPLDKWKGCTIFKPNSAEAEVLTGKKDWKEQSRFIIDALNCEAVVITRGDNVVGICDNEYFEYSLTAKVNVQSTVGAGDSFCAFLAMAVGHGFSTSDSIKIAHQAGSIYVQHEMNKPVSPAELCLNGIVVPTDLKERDFKLVLANGCFDVVHQGHMELLKFAKSKGDRLVVAINSDESIRRIKGESRPIIPLDQRMAIISNIKCVDFVCSFDEDNPYEVIKQMMPDVLVKGDQYQSADIIGSDIVAETCRCPMIENLSTTNIIKKINSLTYEKIKQETN